MNIKKFNERMARPKYSKGGYIKKIAGRKYFDTGGIAQNVTPAGVGGPGQATNTNGTGIGGISNALGLNAASANIQQGTNAAQLNNSYTGANNALNAQIGLTNTLTPQAASAVNNQNAVAQQELAMTQGAGPNPALNQLAQATGTNVANQAALAAGQRGSNANAGLLARQGAQAGATQQEQAAGQAATLEAQQQIAAQNNLANLANQQIGQTQGATTALNTGQQNEQNILQNANTAANNAAVGMQSNINNVNAQMDQGILGGISSGASSALGAVGLAEGGKVEPVHGKHKLEFVHKMAKMALDHFKDGGPVPSPTPSKSAFSSYPSSEANTNSHDPYSGPPGSGSSAPIPIDPKGAQSLKDAFADGGQIQSNPLISGIVNNSSTMPQGPGYQSVQSSSGPNIQNTPASSMNLAQSAQQGYQAGQDIYNKNKADKQVDDAGTVQPSQLGNSAGYGVNNSSQGSLGVNTSFGNSTPMASNDSNALGNYNLSEYKGGSIWDINPSQHSKYASEHFSKYFAKGGESKKVDAMVSPGEVYLPPDAVERVKHGADPLKEGMRIPGKAKVKGDSLKNDIVPASLEEGGVVIDRKNVGNSDKARLFVLKSLKATGKHMKRPGGMK